MTSRTVRLPLLVEHRPGAMGVHERIEVDFEQVLREGIPMSDVGKLRIARGDQAIPAPEAQAHFDSVNRWGAGNSSVNDFIGGNVPASDLNGSLRRFACWADVHTDNNVRSIDWSSAMPATRWIEADHVHCFEANKNLFLTVRQGGAGQIMNHRQKAQDRAKHEIIMMAEDVYAPVLSDSLFRGGPAELALWNCSPQTIDSPEVVSFKNRCKSSEAGLFFLAVMDLVAAQFAAERAAIADLKKVVDSAAPRHTATSVIARDSNLGSFSQNNPVVTPSRGNGLPGPAIRSTRGVRTPPPHSRKLQKNAL